jgi:hypothetical protein
MTNAEIVRIPRTPCCIGDERRWVYRELALSELAWKRGDGPYEGPDTVPAKIRPRSKIRPDCRRCAERPPSAAWANLRSRCLSIQPGVHGKIAASPPRTQIAGRCTTEDRAQRHSRAHNTSSARGRLSGAKNSLVGRRPVSEKSLAFLPVLDQEVFTSATCESGPPPKYRRQPAVTSRSERPRTPG